MRNSLLMTALCGFAFAGSAVRAADHADATISAACSGKSNASVALRWGSPNYDSNPIRFMDRLTISCDAEGPPKTVHNNPVRVMAPDSVFEVQTEGGIDTSYNITVTLNSQKPPLNNFFTLVHQGTPTTSASSRGFTLIRSAGPNKYGEQNFRVQFTAPLPVSAKVQLQSQGTESSTQVALRWGHPNYDSKGYIKLWKVKPGIPQTQQFSIKDAKSEFEIQTEGGDGMSYSMLVWFDEGTGFPRDPDIDLEYSLNKQPDFSSGTTDMTFEPTHGNIYGEGNVKVHAPWITTQAPPVTPLAPLTLNLVAQGTWFESTFSPLGATGKLLTVQNGEDFPIVIIADQNMPGGCAGAANTPLGAHQSLPASQVYGANVAYPKMIGACTSSALTTGRQGLAVVFTYQPN